MQARFRAALELRDLMIAMRREALRRDHPAEPAARIEERLREWVLGPAGHRGADERPSA